MSQEISSLAVGVRNEYRGVDAARSRHLYRVVPTSWDPHTCFGRDVFAATPDAFLCDFDTGTVAGVLEVKCIRWRRGDKPPWTFPRRHHWRDRLLLCQIHLQMFCIGVNRSWVCFVSRNRGTSIFECRFSDSFWCSLARALTDDAAELPTVADYDGHVQRLHGQPPSLPDPSAMAEPLLPPRVTRTPHMRSTRYLRDVLARSRNVFARSPRGSGKTDPT